VIELKLFKNIIGEIDLYRESEQKETQRIEKDVSRIESLSSNLNILHTLTKQINPI
jgi:hypothetical protein